jgi:hypothetical protein
MVLLGQMPPHNLDNFLLIQRQQTDQVHLLNNLQKDNGIILQHLLVALLE